MKKLNMIVGALSLALVSTPIQAINDKDCSFDLDYDFAIKNSEITFSKSKGNKVFINRDNQLFVNGVEQSLNSEQQLLMDNYANGVRDLIPEITNIAIDGVSLGVKAASMALSTLLGDGSPQFAHFNERVTHLADSITSKLSSTDFSTSAIEESFGAEFEEEIETVVEEAIAEITPIIMAQIVTAAMSGGDNSVSDLEMRAENLEHQIKGFIEPQAEALEARAEELCLSIAALDNLETKMVESGLEMMDLISEGGHGGFKFNHDKFNFDLSE